MIFIIERNGKPIGAVLTGDKPAAFLTDDAFSDLLSEQATDQATPAEKSHRSRK